MDYRKIKDTIYLRVDKGEAVIETIKKVCERERKSNCRALGRKFCVESGIDVWNLAEEN